MKPLSVEMACRLGNQIEIQALWAVRDYCHVYCATKLTYELPSHDWPKREGSLES